MLDGKATWLTTLGLSVFLAIPAPSAEALDDDIVISNTTISTNETYRACQSIMVGPFLVVASGARLSLVAPTISFVDDVSIQGGLGVGGSLCDNGFALAGRLASPVSFDLCLSATSFFSGALGNVDVCKTTTCAGGGAGCPIQAHFDGVSVPGGLTGVQAQIDLDAFPINYSFGSGVFEVDCIVSVTNASASVSTDFSTAPVCTAQFDEIIGLSGFSAPLTQNTFDNCTVGLEVEMIVLYQAAVQDGILQLFEDRLVGDWLCPAP